MSDEPVGKFWKIPKSCEVREGALGLVVAELVSSQLKTSLAITKLAVASMNEDLLGICVSIH